MSAGTVSPALKRLASGIVAAAERAVRVNPPTKDEYLASIKSFLFLQYDQALGTAVHATPVFEALKCAVPDAQISVACVGMAHNVLRYNPHISRLIETPHPFDQFFAAGYVLRRAWPELGGLPVAIVTTTGSSRTRIALLGMLAGPGFRLGFTIARPLYHRVLVYDPMMSQIDNNLRVIGALGHTYEHSEPRVYFSPAEVDSARRMLAGQGINNGKPCAVMVTQVSGGQRTRWRDERFLAVAEHLRARGYQILFVGASAEARDIDRLRTLLGRTSFSLAGKTDIPTLSAVLCLADLAVALDTGTMHVGRAAELPMVVIAPAWQPAIEWLPLEREHCVVLRGPDLPVMPPDYCIDEVSSAQAIAAIDRLLKKFPPSPEARHARIRLNLSGVLSGSRRKGVLNPEEMS
jgi:ADP-heptose:LPS heptosyltransferase